jgi:hypothetical protein
VLCPCRAPASRATLCQAARRGSRGRCRSVRRAPAWPAARSACPGRPPPPWASPPPPHHAAPTAGPAPPAGQRQQRRSRQVRRGASAGEGCRRGNSSGGSEQQFRWRIGQQAAGSVCSACALLRVLALAYTRMRANPSRPSPVPRSHPSRQTRKNTAGGACLRRVQLVQQGEGGAGG